MQQQFTKKFFLTNSARNIAGLFVAGLFGYLFQLLVTRKLSVEEYGELQSITGLLGLLSIAWVTLAYLVGRYSAVIGAAHDAAAARGFLSWLNRRKAAVIPVVFAAYLASTPFIAAYLHLPSVTGLVWIGISAIFMVLVVGDTGILTGWGNFTVTNVATIVAAVAKLVAGAAIVVMAPTASAVALAFIFAAAVRWVVLRMSTRRLIGSGAGTDWRASYFAGLDVRKTIGPILAFSLAAGLVRNMDILLVKNLTTASTAGFYGVLTLFGSLILMVNTAITQVAGRAVCAAEYREPGSGRRHLNMAYLLIMVVSGVGTMVYATFSHLIINAVVGAKYTPAAADLWLFGVSAFVASLLFLEVTLSYARNDLWISVVLAVTALMIGLTIYLFHATIRELAIDVIVSLSVGYGGAFIFNQMRRSRCKQPFMPAEVAAPVV